MTVNLNTENREYISWQFEQLDFGLLGGLKIEGLERMRVTLKVEYKQQAVRHNLDLYNNDSLDKLIRRCAERFVLGTSYIAGAFAILINLLEAYRLDQIKLQAKEKEPVKQLSETEMKQAEDFMKQPTLLQRTNKLLGQSGIVGEERNRLFLFVIAISHKMPETLHALIQGSSGSGKTRLLKQISDCIPNENVTKLTRLSDKVLYNFPENYLVNRLICLEDIDGLSEEAEFAFRELQSNGELNSATSVKSENGQISSGQKTVRGPIASLACTTRGEIYEDNMSRVFLIAVDETLEQTRSIIEYQNRKAAGLIDARKESQIKGFIQNLVRMLQPYEVVNPFAAHIQLPEEAHKIRRLNDLFQSFVKMITLLNQYQRNRDEQKRLITAAADIETAIDIMFESIVLKVDELDGSLRQFFEKLKVYVANKGPGYEFTRFEIREATGVSKTQQHHYMNQLVNLEYVRQHGFANRGFKYKIVHWDNYAAMCNRIKDRLTKQLEAFKTEHHRKPARTPKLATGKQ